jgi:hypothetical protein
VLAAKRKEKREKREKRGENRNPQKGKHKAGDTFFKAPTGLL